VPDALAVFISAPPNSSPLVGGVDGGGSEADDDHLLGFGSGGWRADERELEGAVPFTVETEVEVVAGVCLVSPPMRGGLSGQVFLKKEW